MKEVVRHPRAIDIARLQGVLIQGRGTKAAVLSASGFSVTAAEAGRVSAAFLGPGALTLTCQLPQV